jgi:hypothetical protein
MNGARNVCRRRKTSYATIRSRRPAPTTIRANSIPPTMRLRIVRCWYRGRTTYQPVLARRQVTEFEDYGLCWPGDQLKAEGLVSAVRRYANVKHSFTRVQQAGEDHRLKEAREKRKAAETEQKRGDDRAALRTRLKVSPSLGAMTDLQQRGLALEGVLDDLFKIDGLSIPGAFAKEISRHLVRVYGRAGALGLFVSPSPSPSRQFRNARTRSASRSSCWPR